MTCPLCSADTDLIAIDVDGGPFGAQAEVCALCAEQIAGEPDANHWRGLASAMWSEEPAVQVIAARMLKRLSGEGWAQDLAEQLYLDDETQAWADNIAAASDHKDANGAPLAQGDTVVLVKGLRPSVAQLCAGSVLWRTTPSTSKAAWRASGLLSSRSM
jgi:protein PhnA